MLIEPLFRAGKLSLFFRKQLFVVKAEQHNFPLNFENQNGKDI